MENATISALKNQHRDRPVARLDRVTADGTDPDRIARLERKGLLKRGRGELPPGLFTADVPVAKQSVLEALVAERREER